MKYILAFFLTACVCYTSFAQKNNKTTDGIIYYVFDSAETFLCKAVKWKLKTEDSVFVAIEQLPQTKKPIYRIYIIGYKDQPWPENVSRSNRRMRIFNQTYPIYIIGLDQLFGEDPMDSNPINRLSFPQEIVKNRSPYIEVDLLSRMYKINGPLFE